MGATGAVRHGAESFNLYFPQELDEEYLIVWEKFPDKPWAYKTEEQLREFLMERIDDGYCFPLNPVWPVRDRGWYEIFDALEYSVEAEQAMQSWYPPESGISETIHAIHALFPETFSTKLSPGVPDRPSYSGSMSMADLDLCERTDLGLFRLGRMDANLKKASIKVARIIEAVRANASTHRGGSLLGSFNGKSPTQNYTNRLTLPSARTSACSSWRSDRTSTCGGETVRHVRTGTLVRSPITEGADEADVVAQSAPTASFCEPLTKTPSESIQKYDSA